MLFRLFIFWKLVEIRLMIVVEICVVVKYMLMCFFVCEGG